MSKTSGPTKLPASIREQLDERLRSAAYGDLVQCAAWLDELGHSISKSALGRYAIQLRLTDAKGGRGLAQLLETPKPLSWTTGRSSRQKAILAELVRLQSLQANLIAELASL